MRHLQLSVLFVLFAVSCQSLTTEKTAQKHIGDTAKENKPTASINSTKFDTLNGDFSNFWQKFRASVLNFDTTLIIENTVFPFQTRGSLDSDPTIEYSKKKFVHVFKAFLNQWNGLDLEGSSELDLVKKMELPKKDDVQGNYARIGDMVFNKSNKNWKFVFAYLDEETIESLKK